MKDLLTAVSEKIGIKVNLQKTKTMTNTQITRNVIVNDNNLEKVEEYIYLGQIIKPGKKNAQ